MNNTALTEAINNINEDNLNDTGAQPAKKTEDESLNDTRDIDEIDKEIEERHNRKRITFFKKKFKMDFAGRKHSFTHTSSTILHF